MESILGNNQNNQQVQAPMLGNDEPGILDNIVGFLKKPEIQAMANAALPVATGQGGYNQNAYSAALQGLSNFNVNKVELDRQNRKDRIAELTAMANIRSKQAYMDSLRFNQNLATKRFGLDSALNNAKLARERDIQNLLFGNTEILGSDNQGSDVAALAPYQDDKLKMTVLPDNSVQSPQNPKRGSVSPELYMKLGVLENNPNLFNYGKYLTEQDKEKVLKQNRERQKLLSADSNVSTIDESLRLINEDNAGGGILGKSLGAFVPGSDSYDLDSLLTTIKSNLSFDKLQSMRENSPTGGALGSVSDSELELLASSVANLDIGQSQGQLVDNLNKVRNHYARIMGYDVSKNSRNNDVINFNDLPR